MISVTYSDAPSNNITITYDSKFRIDYVTDYNGRKFDFIYDNTRNLLSKIECSAADNTSLETLDVAYSYDSSKNLIEVVFYGDTSAEYTYDENGNIASVTFKKNCRVEYEYDDKGRITKVTEQTYINENYITGNISICTRLSPTQIKFTDKYNNYEVFQFNSKGQFLYKSTSSQSSQSTTSNENDGITNVGFQNDLEGWTTTDDFSITESTINEQSVSAIELPGGADVENTILKTVEIEGNKNDYIAVFGWFKGYFTNSSTNNAWLLNAIKEAENPNVCNFTNDRYAQIEVSYQYTENGSAQPLTETIVIPFSENLEDWQYASEGFLLKGNCTKLLVVIRYSNNANPALLSNIEIAKNSGYKINVNKESNQVESMYIGLREVLSYTYNGDKISSVEYTDNAYQKHITQFEYDVNRKLIRIYEDGKPKYTPSNADGPFTSVTSADNRIIRYVDDLTSFWDFNNLSDYTEIENGNYFEIIDENGYKIRVYDVTYNVIAGPSVDKSEVVSKGGNAISVNSKQDWYGRRSSNIVETKENYDTDSESVLVAVETRYEYDNSVVYETFNNIKTYINRIYSGSMRSGTLLENYEFYYEYDDNGNIIKEYAPSSENTTELRYSYKYDHKNQLVRYNDNVSTQKYSYTYEYDSNGNMLSKSTYSYAPPENDLGQPLSTVYYEYSVDSKLIEYNNTPISYDDNGNPVSFNGATLTWDGKKLESYEITDNNTDITTKMEYSYDDSGVITEKRVIVDEVLKEKYNYTWVYGKLVNMEYINQETTHTVKFIYDPFNSPQGFIVNHSKTYLYMKNIYGDVVGVVDEQGDIVLSYSYDAWGDLEVSVEKDDALNPIITAHPLTYRGYCYDYDMDLYYLGEEFYNPETGGFLSSDDIEKDALLKTSAIDDFYNYWKNHPAVYGEYNENETYLANSIANYLYNKSVSNFLTDSSDGTFNYIYNQTADNIKDYRYGFSKTGNIGCGWVATYNNLIILGDPMNTYDVIREYETNGAFVYGCWGTHPVAIASFFIKRGYEVNLAFENFENIVPKYNANIMYYLSSSNNHFVAIKYNDDGTFKGYNAFCAASDIEDLGDSVTAISKDNKKYDGNLLISISPKEET